MLQLRWTCDSLQPHVRKTEQSRSVQLNLQPWGHEDTTAQPFISTNSCDLWTCDLLAVWLLAIKYSLIWGLVLKSMYICHGHCTLSAFMFSFNYVHASLTFVQKLYRFIVHGLSFNQSKILLNNQIILNKSTERNISAALCIRMRHKCYIVTYDFIGGEGGVLPSSLSSTFYLLLFKTEFVKLKISLIFNKILLKTHSKQPKKTIGKSIPTYGFYKSQEITANQMSRDICLMFVNSKFNRKSTAWHTDFYSLWFPSQATERKKPNSRLTLLKDKSTHSRLAHKEYNYQLHRRQNANTVMSRSTTS
jgi:hypothetical protein